MSLQLDGFGGFSIYLDDVPVVNRSYVGEDDEIGCVDETIAGIYCNVCHSDSLQ